LNPLRASMLTITLLMWFLNVNKRCVALIYFYHFNMQFVKEYILPSHILKKPNDQFISKPARFWQDFKNILTIKQPWHFINQHYICKKSNLCKRYVMYVLPFIFTRILQFLFQIIIVIIFIGRWSKSTK
jgi:hypothetical protein